MFNIKIKKTSLIVASKEPLASGASKIYHVSFDFDQEWEGLLKNVIFKAGDTSVAVLLEGTSCLIPWEVLSSENIGEKLWIGVYGSDTEGTKLPTIWNELEVIQAGAELCGSGSEPTPTAVSLIYGVAKNAESMAKEAVEEASKAKTYASQASEAKEEAEEAAKEAKSAVSSAQVEVRLAWDEAERATAQANLADESSKSAFGSAKLSESCMNSAGNYSNSANLAMGKAAESAESAAESAEIAKANTADIKKQCANAIRGRLFGASVRAEDVSPIEHELDVKVRSKNIISYPYLQPSSSLKPQGLNIVYGDDGGITISGKNTKTNEKGELVLYEFEIFKTDILLTEELFVSGCPEGGSNSKYRIMIGTINPNGDSNYFADDGNGKLINKGYTLKTISIRIAAGYDFGEESVTFYPQVEYGTATTDYSRYVDAKGVNVTVSDGENTQTGTADADGNVSGLMSFDPGMTLTTDNAGAMIECTYNRDTNKVIEELEEKIENIAISLGGNI